MKELRFANFWLLSPANPSLGFFTLLILGLFGLLMLSGASLIPSCFLFVTLGLQYVVGVRLTTIFFKVKPSFIPDPIPLALGAVFFTATSQLTRIWAEPAERKQIVLLIILLFLLFSQLIRTVFQTHSNSQILRPQLFSPGRNFALIVLASTILTLSVTWLWIVPLLAVGMILSQNRRFSISRHTRAVFLFIVGCSFLSLLYSVRFRSQFWWLPGWGLDEHKLFTISVWNWGPFSDPLSANIPFNYQWLGYAILGDWTTFSGFDAFQMVSRVSPIMVSALLAISATAIALEFGISGKAAKYAPIMTSTSITILSQPVAYSILSINYFPPALLYIVCWFLQLIRWQKNNSIGNFCLVCIFSISAIATKSVHVVPIFIGVLVFVLGEGLRKIDLKLVIEAVILFFLLSIYIYLFFPDFKQSGLEEGALFSYLRQLGVFSSSAKLTIFIGALHLLILSIPVLVILLIPNVPKPSLVTTFLVSISVVGVFAALWLDRTQGTQLHFFQVAITLGIFCIPPSFLHLVLRNNLFLPPLRSRFVLLFVVGAIANTAVHAPIIISRQTILDRQLLAFNVVGVVITVVLTIYGMRFVGRVGLQSVLGVGLAFSLLCALPANWAINRFRAIHQTDAVGQLGDSDLVDIANYVERFTDLDSVGATDIFFSDGRDLCQQLSSSGTAKTISMIHETNYFTPAVVIERRFLVVAPLYGFYFTAIDPSERIEASIRFGCVPSRHSLRKLTDLGVEWFLSRNTALTDLFPAISGKVVYRNRQYVLVSLL